MPEVLLHPASILSTLALFQNESVILACDKAKTTAFVSQTQTQRY